MHTYKLGGGIVISTNSAIFNDDHSANSDNVVWTTKNMFELISMRNFNEAVYLLPEQNGLPVYWRGIYSHTGKHIIS